MLCKARQAACFDLTQLKQSSDHPTSGHNTACRVGKRCNEGQAILQQLFESVVKCME